MKELRNIIDTWNMINKYDLKGCVRESDSVILVPLSEYDRLLNSVKNKRYVQNLLASNGSMFGGRSTIC